MADKRNRRHVLAIRGNEIVVKIVFHSSPWTARAPFGKKKEDDRESVPSPYAEDVPPWLHVPPLKRRDGDRPVEAKEIKQRGEPARDEREGKTAGRAVRKAREEKW